MSRFTFDHIHLRSPDPEATATFSNASSA